MTVNYQKIYEKLGYLFYAIAAADGRVRQEEIDELRKTIQLCWLPLENSTDEFNTDASQYIFFSFDYLVVERMPPEEAYNIFEDYYKEHYRFFDDTIRHNLLSTAYSVSTVFREQNRNELDYLGRLEKLMRYKGSSELRTS